MGHHRAAARGGSVGASLAQHAVTRGNPALGGRGLIERQDHPVVGWMSHVGIPWLLTDDTNGVRSPAPTYGQHAHQVLADVVGLSEAEVAALERAGVLR